MIEIYCSLLVVLSIQCNEALLVYRYGLIGLFTTTKLRFKNGMQCFVRLVAFLPQMLLI